MDHRGIVQFDTAAMIFQHAPDDRQAKTGALLARRDVWLKQPRAADIGQADAVIDNVDDNIVIVARNGHFNTPLGQKFFRNSLDGLVFFTVESGGHDLGMSFFTEKSAKARVDLLNGSAPGTH